MTSQLLPGENLILKDHPHWIVVVKSLAAPMILLIVAVVIDVTAARTGIPHFRTIVTLAAIAIAGLWLIVVWMRWQSTSYTLTDQRIKIETGVFGRQSKMIPIDRVQDCTTKQSLIGPDARVRARRGRCRRRAGSGGAGSSAQPRGFS